MPVLSGNYCNSSPCKAEAEAHLLEGLKIALDHLDAIIALIRKSKDPQAAKSINNTRSGLRMAGRTLEEKLHTAERTRPGMRR